MTNQKKNNKKKKEESFFKSTKFLLIIFILLFILVSVLGVLCVIKNKEAKIKAFSNINFALVDDNEPISFGINALTLAQTDEYIFKVTNYKGKKVNKKKREYKVIIENKNDCIISVTVNDLEDNVMTDQESTELTDTLKAKEKEAVYYHVKVKEAGDLDSQDLIRIRIE